MHHGPDDVLTPEPEDAFDEDDYREGPTDTESTSGTLDLEVSSRH